MRIDEQRIIDYLSQGMTQQEVSAKLKKGKIYPASVSSIEKTCSALRKRYKAKTNFQLAVKLCRKGYIR